MPRKLSVEKISVIVPTYNRADYLHLCLTCLIHQGFTDDWEIVVADDGSNDATGDVVSKASRDSRSPPIRYLWREDKGYRRAWIINEGARAATGDLLVVLDSDCMARPDLLTAYAANAGPDSFYLGGIWKLNRACAERLLAGGGSVDGTYILQQAAQKENHLQGQRLRFFKRYLKSKLAPIFKLSKPKIWGGNFAVNREVFEAVNGFDESFEGWGREDSDLRNRLVRGGYRSRALHTTALAYHLWHKKDWSLHTGPDGQRSNVAYYRRPNVDVTCKNGLRKL